MSNHLDGDTISPCEATTGGLIRVERVWQHRHDIELHAQKSRRKNSLRTIGAGGLFLGAVCIFAYSGLGSPFVAVPDQAMASYPVGEETELGSTKLRDVVNTMPLQEKISVTEARVAVPAYAVIPTKRPIATEADPITPKKARHSSFKSNPSDVVHFDQCRQGCESRDPLVVGTVRELSTVPDVVSSETTGAQRPNKALEIGKAAINGAGFVLVETASLPFTTLKLGRNAAMAISGMD
ncbi:hypothetical protein DXT91_28105 [Agrobacterium tumefaciens]|uniref:hypothetical protein n=1 Tax=Agrobacterium tumefaciens TaxID=358 RepID=UPI0012B6E56E|nr:hypothetical protein [Agrobacterium tumefaciens]MQB07908.1 hypothetical protein [Agrobacterium tumefaciens]